MVNSLLCHLNNIILTLCIVYNFRQNLCTVISSLILCPIDIDECNQDSDDCKQFCVNLDGTFECTCFVNYVLDDDQRTCCKCSSIGLQAFVTDLHVHGVGMNMRSFLITLVAMFVKQSLANLKALSYLLVQSSFLI